MLKSITKLFATKTRSTSKPARKVQLSVEALEDRAVPTAIGGALQAVSSIHIYTPSIYGTSYIFPSSSGFIAWNNHNETLVRDGKRRAKRHTPRG